MAEPAAETFREREDRAAALLEQRIRREAVVDSRLDEHDRRLEVINGSIRNTGAALKGVELEVSKLTLAVERREAVSQALADAAQDLANEQITSKQFFIGVAAIVISFAGVVATVLTHI